MRKKSHLSLAKYMVENLEDEGLHKHRFSFYLGSILPDIKPSFLYRRHEIGETFPAFGRLIERLWERRKNRERVGRKYYVDLGQVSHYLADYFTFPHNTIYPGGLKEHCAYEKKLKRDLRTDLKRRNGETGYHSAGWEKLRTAKALCDFVEQEHRDYLGRRHDVEDDIRHIVSVNQKVLGGMTKVRALQRAE